MEYFIAIDGGGTKTESVLMDGNGHILQYNIRRGCNPFNWIMGWRIPVRM